MLLEEVELAIEGSLDFVGGFTTFNMTVGALLSRMSCNVHHVKSAPIPFLGHFSWGLTMPL